MPPRPPRALFLALALIASSPALAADYTPEDVAQAVKREFPEDTIMLMIEGQEWDLDDEATRRLLRAGVPAKYVALMLGENGLSVDKLETMAAARPLALPPDIEGCSGSFCVVTTQDGEKYRGQILAATATSVVLVQVDDSVRVLPRESVVAATPARATLREWRTRVGKSTFVALADGEIVDGELVAAEDDVLVLRTESGEFLTIAAEDVGGLVLSKPTDRGEAEEGGQPDARSTRDDADLPQANTDDEANDVGSARWVDNARNPLEKVRRGHATAAAGLTLGGVSGALYGAGLLWGSAEIYVIGSIGLAVAPPIVAGGSLRARRGVTEAGGNAAAGLGFLSWGFWGGAVALSVVALDSPTPEDSATVGTVSNVLLLGAFVSGGLQIVANDAGLRDQTTRRGMPRGEDVSLALVFNGRGLTLSGQF